MLAVNVPWERRSSAAFANVGVAKGLALDVILSCVCKIQNHMLNLFRDFNIFSNEKQTFKY